tara:strand:+ start:2258 stop:2380 length:123 start_codon:yes stop_codon:yes gene_type:complete
MTKKELTIGGLILFSLIGLKYYKGKWRRNRLNKIKNNDIK